MQEPRLDPAADLLERILSEPAFDILRTKEQLGYTVSCCVWNQFPLTVRGKSVRIQLSMSRRFADKMKVFLHLVS